MIKENFDFLLTGKCLSRKDMSNYVSNMQTKVAIESVSETVKEARYALTESSTGNSFTLSCNGQRITVIR